MGRTRTDLTENAYASALPRAVYFQCIWVIKDMDRLRMLEAIRNYQGQPDEVLCCTSDGCSMFTEKVLDEAVRKLTAVRAALSLVPEDMRHDLIENINSGAEFGDFAHENTWKKWKKRFICELARDLDLI